MAIKIDDSKWHQIVETGEFPCELYHPGFSCTTYGLHKSFLTAVTKYKYYIPFHLIPLLLFKRKDLRKHPVSTLMKALVHYIRSLLFMTTTIGLLYFFCCIIRKIKGKMDSSNELFSAFLGSLIVIIESAGRREEISLFIFPRFLESFWNLLKHRKIVKPVANGENLLFGFAMGLIAYFYQNENTAIKRSYLAAFRTFWGKN